MLLKKVASGLAIALVATATVFAGDVDLEGVKCVVASKPADAEKSADYKDGKVYFCCNGCAGKFAKNKEKFANSANRQLVATKQYEQKACPISGRELNPETGTEVSGVKVTFCCNGCKGKVEKAEGDAKVKLVFSEKAFAKAFAKAAEETE
ncbi:YHS domain-containing protein [Rhodopirellula maiorica SM1]|uniref:YHS domain-containing protein n=2 Tax=Novipirellula TaxID=2795426 RepID=M5RRX6_9BACT|nr:YHS domain-containing protein [Rhodopirellula maiorica SM1]